MEQVELNFIKDLKENIKHLYLALAVSNRYTGVTASRKGYYRLSDLVEDMKNYTLKLFKINQLEFEELWTNFTQLIQMYNVDIFEDMGYKTGKVIFKNCKDLLNKDVEERIKKISNIQKKGIFLYFDYFYTDYYLYDVTDKFYNSFHLIFNEILDEDLADILVKVGLLLQSTWITSKGKNKGLTYNFTSFIDEIIPDIQRMLKKDIGYPKVSKSLKTFEKRFNYLKNSDSIFEYIGLDYLINRNEEFTFLINFIRVNGIKYFLEHPNIIKGKVINPLLASELNDSVKNVKVFLFKRFEWLQKIFKKHTDLFFLVEEDEYSQKFSSEIDREQYYIQFNCWYYDELIKKNNNSIQVLFYHPNFKTIMENIYDPNYMKGVIAFGEDFEVFVIGENDFIVNFKKILSELKKRKFHINIKEINIEEFQEIHQHIDTSDKYDIKRIVEILEKIDERIDGLEVFLQEKLGSEYQKIKFLLEKYRNDEISRKQLLLEGSKILGRNFFKIWSGFS